MAIDLFQELTKLRRQILTMGANVEQQVQGAVAALRDRDTELAAKVRKADKSINSMEVDIEEEALRILALSHPVASDLRFVLAVMRINTNLERVGDLAKSIAKRVIDLIELGYYEVPDSLDDMCDESIRMLNDVLSALADQNPELARRVRLADDRVDDLQKEVFAWTRDEINSNVDRTEAAIDFMSIARKLERVGDMSTNIAEDVIFLTEGSLVRHKHDR